MNRKTALSLIIVLWTCSLYGGLLGHGFVGDDTASIGQNMALRETTPLSRFFLDLRRSRPAASARTRRSTVR